MTIPVSPKSQCSKKISWDGASINDTTRFVPLGNEQPASVRCQNERNKVTHSKAFHKQQPLSQSHILHCPSLGSIFIKEWLTLVDKEPGLKLQRLLSTWNVKACSLINDINFHQTLIVRTSTTSSLSINCHSLSSLSTKHVSTQAEVWCYFLSSPIHLSLIACCPNVHGVVAWISTCAEDAIHWSWGTWNTKDVLKQFVQISKFLLLSDS